MSNSHESIYFESPFTSDDLMVLKQRIAIEMVKQSYERPSFRYKAILNSLRVLALGVFMSCMGAVLMLPVVLLRLR
ncbi:MAG: hypothetical protein LW809_05500 [Vampirovibrionales bacterium]|jgi:hypothetical protein|nr:hypothetical protein [Vampirovibrionales bacterium]